MPQAGPVARGQLSTQPPADVGGSAPRRRVIAPFPEVVGRILRPAIPETAAASVRM
jgi:hypothetical protein